MPGGLHQTLSNDIVAVRDLAPHLFLVVNSDHPRAAPLRLALRHLEQIELRRAPGDAGADATLSVDQKSASLLVPDSWMSTVHARLERVMGTWSIEDSASRNGTFLNGHRIRRAALRDGDLIEAGHTFFIFRESFALAASHPASDARRASPAFATLLPPLEASFEQLERVAQTRIPVLILGETGTGKDLLASSLHELSGRRGLFQAVHCAALGGQEAQSALFGRGETAAEADMGLVRAAEGGTLYFDELFDLPPGPQSLLLATLQDGEAHPAGATRPVRVDVRIVAATNHALEELAAASRVRADLLARMSGFTIRLPALRERREDIGLLVRGMVAGGKMSFSVEAMRAMLLHRWPLNVRELEKTVQAAAVVSRGEPIRLEDLPTAIRAATREPDKVQAPAAKPEASGLQRFVDELSRRHVVRVVVAYAVAVFGALQGFDIIVTRLSLPSRWMVWLVIASLVGLPAIALLSWVYDWTRAGIVRTAPLAPGAVAPPAVQRVQRRMLALALLILAVLAAGGIVWWRARLT